MSETDLSRAIRESLTAAGVWCIRVQSGKLRIGRRWLHLAEPGTPDIWTPYGWLEIKVPGGKRSPEQIAWHERAARLGVRVATAESIKEAFEVISRWKAQSLCK